MSNSRVAALLFFSGTRGWLRFRQSFVSDIESQASIVDSFDTLSRNARKKANVD